MSTRRGIPTGSGADHPKAREHYTVVRLPEPVWHRGKLNHFGLRNNRTGRIPRHSYRVTEWGAVQYQRSIHGWEQICKIADQQRRKPRAMDLRNTKPVGSA